MKIYKIADDESLTYFEKQAKRENKIKLQKLIIEATEACRWRGHTLEDRWEYSYGPNRATAANICTKCKKSVDVDTRPHANGIDMAGEALALGCND